VVSSLVYSNLPTKIVVVESKNIIDGNLESELLLDHQLVAKSLKEQTRLKMKKLY
jgi:hypothetical protein